METRSAIGLLSFLTVGSVFSLMEFVIVYLKHVQGARGFYDV